jgi:hypothetical protein
MQTLSIVVVEQKASLSEATCGPARGGLGVTGRVGSARGHTSCGPRQTGPASQFSPTIITTANKAGIQGRILCESKLEELLSRVEYTLLACSSCWELFPMFEGDCGYYVD